MKLTKITLGFFTAATILIIGCSATQTISEESLGIRKTSLYSENDAFPVKTEYIKKAAGESKLIERAFENAPPMIPHNVEGMYPITTNNNACTGCHLPAVAEAINATVIPQSHFTNFRPDTSLAKNGKIAKEGKAVTNTSDFKVIGKPLTKLSGTRFNCTQCHVPQSMTSSAPKNEFEVKFRAVEHNKKSNLIDNINEGVDTIN
ncbi:nitrate reductase cytochrome c-type subunit [Arcobacter sp. LA11]|uniref:nitrate reductase cytochrome c-type subunit n=1 Tax=Arcobacter sp. LA11 TaxID=1898176 RepID=UPI00093417D9|nr:nitrate reductase cytochrome c-type subunit [Arcobacter sp. LA11]